MDPGLKLQFRKHSEIRIWKFKSVFTVEKCRFSPSLGIVIRKLVQFKISVNSINVVSFLLKVLYYTSMVKAKVSKTFRNQN